jgi:glutamate synthase (NADPH) small chain
MSQNTGNQGKGRVRPPRQVMPERSPDERNKDFNEVATGFTAEMAVAEAERCLQCKKPLCVQGCPVGINIPAFIEYIAEGEFGKAARRIKQDTNLPAICGRVCPQESQCEETCIVGRKHKPVAIGALERFVADHERESGSARVPELGESSSKHIAVVGSGPSGLTAAGELARMGHDVTVFEALHEPGGVLVYGIPEFRLPKAIVANEVESLRKMGVNFELNVVIGQSLTVDDLFNEGTDAIFIGTGAGLPYFLDIPGENLNGVYTANEFLTRVNLMKAYRFPEYHTPVHVGKNVAVFGGGNTAMDAARTAKRMGPDSVKLLYRRSEAEMPARLEEVHHGHDEGIEFVTLTAPLEFVNNGDNWVSAVKVIHMELGEPDASGRRRPVPIPGSEETIEIDTAIIAIGNGPNRLIPQTTPGLEISSHGTIIAKEESGLTSRHAVFAGGDVVTGAATVIQAMGAGKAAAAAIDDFVMNRAEHDAQDRYDTLLGGYVSSSGKEHTDEERIELLYSLGITNPEQFLNRRLPHWRARIDELLDPESLDMVPIHLSHAHVRYVRGAIQELPESARARLFTSKMIRTGLIDTVRELYKRSTGEDLTDSFTVESVDLSDDVRQSFRVTIQNEARRFVFDVLRLNPEAEVLFAGVAGVAGFAHCQTVPFITPGGDQIAISVVRSGENLLDSDLLTTEYYRAHSHEMIGDIARQEALADFLGVAMRDGAYSQDTRDGRVYATNHLELFHHLIEEERGEEPIVSFVMNQVLPDDPSRQESVALDLLKRYETAYVDGWDKVVSAWPAIETYLKESRATIENYTGERLDVTILELNRVRRWNPMVHLTRVYEHHLTDIWKVVGPSVWEWRRGLRETA